MNDTVGQCVLITGAGSGIGMATALHLAGRGRQVFAGTLPGEEEAAIRDAAREHRVSLRPLVLDVTREASIRAAVDTVLAEAGAPAAVIHSAGLGLRGFFEDIAEEEIRRLFDVNVFGVMAVTRAILPAMRGAGRGRIVILSSAAGRVPTMTLTAYAAAKFALEGFGESLSMEVAPFGIRVSLIEPGLVLTPHFTVHRGRARAATDPSGPYYAWFVQHEQMVDERLRRQPILPAQVATVIEQALTAARPRLRYPVGRGPRLIFWLRRVLPDRLFEGLYYGAILRRVTRGRMGRLADLTLPGGSPTAYLGLSDAARKDAE